MEFEQLRIMLVIALISICTIFCSHDVCIAFNTGVLSLWVLSILSQKNYSVVTLERVRDEYERKGKYYRLKMKWKNDETNQIETVFAERYPFATLAADLMLVCIPKGQPAHEGHVLLMKRANQGEGSSNVGKWAIPGGCVPDDPSVTVFQQAITELWEETGIRIPTGIDGLVVGHVVGVYDNPFRDTRKRFISIAYVHVIHEMPVMSSQIPCQHEVDGREWFQLGELACRLREERHTNDKFTAFDHHLALVDMMRMLNNNHQLISMLGGNRGINMIKQIPTL